MKCKLCNYYTAKKGSNYCQECINLKQPQEARAKKLYITKGWKW